MLINTEDISDWDSKFRLKFINSVSGYKGVHLIGTKSLSGISNLAIFNSVIHISSEPARLGFIMRPITVTRNTYENILETEQFTINHVHKALVEQAHFTSAKFSSNQSEFELCNFKEHYEPGFVAPAVSESNIKIGLRLVENIKMKESGCHLIVGEIEYVDIKEDYIEADGQIDLELANNVCVTGLNQYSSVKKFVKHEYARVSEKPDFKRKKRPDNIAFDEETQAYNASMLPYGSNVGAPSISTNNLSTWKRQSISTYNHAFQNKIDTLKESYDRLTQEYKTNEKLYQAQHSFEPIIGQVYHLYSKENTEQHFLSLIPPEDWNQDHLGSFQLNSEKVWEPVTKTQS